MLSFQKGGPAWSLVPFAVVALGARCAPRPVISQGSGPERDEPLRTIEPLVTWTGEHSGISEHEFHRIGEPDGWFALWARHRGDGAGGRPAADDTPPWVDFRQCMVIAAFTGSTRQRRGDHLFVDEFEDVIRVRRRDSGYGINNFEPPPVTPYTIIVIPRSTKPVIVEEGSGGPSPKDTSLSERQRWRLMAWKETHRFEPLPEKPAPWAQEGYIGR